MRIIYNTSFIVNDNVEHEWIHFMREHYIAVLDVAVLSEKKLCQDIIFTKVSIDQGEGKTYSLQLVFESETQQNYFLDNLLPQIEEKIISKYANCYLCFSSVLTEI